MKLIILVLGLLGLCQVLGQTTKPVASTEPTKRVITVTSILNDPYLKLTDASLQHNDRYSGYIKDLLDELAERVPFSYSLYLVSDGKYGAPGDDNQWTGMIGELTRKHAQLAAAPLTVTDARDRVIDFSHPFMNVSLSALVQRDSGIKTLDDLLSREEFSYGTIDGGATKKSFQSNSKKPFSTMWAHMASQSPSAFVESTQDGVRRVKKGNYSLILESPQAEFLGITDCEVDKIDDFLPGSPYALAVAEGEDQLLADVNTALESLEADGTLKNLKDNWWGPHCGGCLIQHSVTLLLTAILLVGFIV